MLSSRKKEVNRRKNKRKKREIKEGKDDENDDGWRGREGRRLVEEGRDSIFDWTPEGRNGEGRGLPDSGKVLNTKSKKE